jgi:hypothetical protein
VALVTAIRSRDVSAGNVGSRMPLLRMAGPVELLGLKLPQIDCPECNRLTAEYYRLGREYAAAVNLLNASLAASEVSEYIRLRAAAHEARIKAEMARVKLEKHNGSHSNAN